MSVFGASVQRTHLEIISLLTSNTHGGITTNMECSMMPTTTQQMPNCSHIMFTNDSPCFDIFPVTWATSKGLTSSIQCRSECLTTIRSGFSTSSRCMNSWTSTMQSRHPCLLTMTSHLKIGPMRKFLNGMGRRWRKWAGTCLELYPSPCKAEAPLSVPYSITQLSAHWHC